MIYYCSLPGKLIRFGWFYAHNDIRNYCNKELTLFLTNRINVTETYKCGKTLIFRVLI